MKAKILRIIQRLREAHICKRGLSVIKVAVCDDENQIINLIEKLLLRESKMHHIPLDINAFYSGETLEKAIYNGEQYDLLYLDIHMKGENGIVAAKNIRKVDKNLLIIYVSSYDRYMMELFRLDVFDFIKKPIKPDIFAKSFLAAYKRICSRKIYFSFHYKNEDHKVLCSEILYFESNGRQIRVYIKNGEIEIFNDKLNEVEKRLQKGRYRF
jgi:DNA-binding LytR/AlgR family response regulator